MVRLLYGARASLFVGAGAVLLSLLLAIPLGLAAGYRRGRTDAVISRLFDLLWSFPALLLGALLSTSLTLHGVDVGPARDRVGLEADPDPRDRARVRAVRGAAAPGAGAHAPRAAVRARPRGRPGCPPRG